LEYFMLTNNTVIYPSNLKNLMLYCGFAINFGDLPITIEYLYIYLLSSSITNLPLYLKTMEIYKINVCNKVSDIVHNSRDIYKQNIKYFNNCSLIDHNDPNYLYISFENAYFNEYFKNLIINIDYSAAIIKYIKNFQDLKLNILIRINTSMKSFKFALATSNDINFMRKPIEIIVKSVSNFVQNKSFPSSDEDVNLLGVPNVCSDNDINIYEKYINSTLYIKAIDIYQIVSNIHKVYPNIIPYFIKNFTLYHF
jgi:hypothetical protein